VIYVTVSVCIICSNAQSRTTALRGTVRCHFHVVIVKSDFDYKQDKDFVAVRFDEQKLGGWSDNHMMSVEK